MIEGESIWDLSRIPDREKTRLEFTSLVRFKGYWYCGFREGEIHWNHPSGRGRIIRSADGKDWETAVLLTWEGGDVREVKLFITPDGALMANTSIYFVSREPRAGGRHEWLEHGVDPREGAEANVARQSLSWFSRDGKEWSDACASPEIADLWLWDTTWHNGMGYSIAYEVASKQKLRTLYRTRDGKNWRVLVDDFTPDETCTEGTFTFGADGTAYCLLRRGKPEWLTWGTGKAPGYTQWEWKRARVDWANDGNPQPASGIFRVEIGGPSLLRLGDGRLLAAFRALAPGRDDGHVTVFWIDEKEAVLTKWFECKGTSYPSLAEHEGMLWITYCSADVSSVHLAKVPISA